MPTPSLTIDSLPEIVDLFAGPGGLDVGAAWLGIPTIGIELDQEACATRYAAGLATVQGDVRNYGPSDFPSATVLAGGPPCQTFTVAGSGTGRKSLSEVSEIITQMASGDSAPGGLKLFDDERTGLVLEPMRWILEAAEAKRPFDAIVLEQVPAVLPIWAAYRRALERLGYSVDHGILRSEEFGVPQTRRRAVLVARRGDSVRLPSPTHQRYAKGQRQESLFGLKPWVPMYRALERPPGFVVVSNYGSGGDPRNRGRRRSDEPSATVTGKVMRNRVQLECGKWDRFTHHEAGRLQTFPRNYPWSGKDIGQQIGNAIPPRLAAHVLASTLGLEIDESQLDRFTRAPWSFSGYMGSSIQLLGDHGNLDGTVDAQASLT